MPPSPPSYFFIGSLSANISHTKLRVNASNLNAHLFSLQKVDSPSCSCGYPSENTKHFLLTCPLYQNQRDSLFQTLSSALNTEFSTIPSSVQFEMLVYGKHLGRGLDGVVATAVQRFLILTHRL